MYNKIEKNIWCTLGPSSMNQRTIKRLEESAVSMFRINLSHTPIEEIKSTVLKIQKHTSVPVCIDTEGPQVRTGIIHNGDTIIYENDLILITNAFKTSSHQNIILRPFDIIRELEIGDLISIDFDSALLSIKERTLDGFIAKVICGGKIGSNKAVTIDRKIKLPILSNKDKKGIKILNELKLKNITLSFVNNGTDVKYVRKLIDKDVVLISKIETTEALHNLDEIIDVSDGILIDRGDLSREEPINKIPLLQKKIIEHANKAQKKVFVATNFLESMVYAKTPTRSEVNDVINTLMDGASGLVLAAETAIGKYPVECANMVTRLIKYFEISKYEFSLNELLNYDSFLLIPPHGGELINRFKNNINTKEINNLPKLYIDDLALIDLEQIGIGAYSPLEGFMTKEELSSVLDEYKLPNGQVWPMPILLQIKNEDMKIIQMGMPVALISARDKSIYAVLYVKDKYTIAIKDVAKRWFGTDSNNHPGVKRLFDRGPFCIGGKIHLIKRKHSKYKEYEFTPQQMRNIFSYKGWNKIAAFHTRNPIHRAHEFLQFRAIDKHNLDGVLLHPAIGIKNAGDFCSNIILESYNIMIDNIYPPSQFVLGAFSGYSHYAGPREAVFTALVRKNFGCNFFIIGRDHTGVGDYYKGTDIKRLFNEIGEIGISPIFFNKVDYSKTEKDYIEINNTKIKNTLNISGTELRNMLSQGRLPPDWFMREEISNMILNKIKNNEEVFI